MVLCQWLASNFWWCLHSLPSQYPQKLPWPLPLTRIYTDWCPLYLIAVFHFLSSLGWYWQLVSDGSLNLSWLHLTPFYIVHLKIFDYELTSHLSVARIFFSISSLGNAQLLAGGSWATRERNEEISVDDLTPLSPEDMNNNVKFSLYHHHYQTQLCVHLHHHQTQT